MSRQVHCLIVCNSKERRKEEKETGKQKKRNNLMSLYIRKMNFYIFLIMEYYTTVKINIININNSQKWNVEDGVHCRINIACYYLNLKQIKVFMDAYMCSKKMHGNNKCSILVGDYCYKGSNRTVLKEEYQGNSPFSIGCF